MDAARAKATKTAKHLEDAREAAAAAAARLKAAEHAAQQASAELAEVEAAVAAQAAQAAQAPPRANVISHVQALLAELERTPVPGIVGTGPALPETLLAAMSALRREIELPTAPGRLDEPLEPDTEPSRPPPSHEPPPDDELMGALDEIDESDEEALLAVARRLKRARHSPP